MKAYEAGTPAYFATPPVQLIYAFNASLQSITKGKVSIEERFRRHREASEKFKTAMSGLGLKQVRRHIGRLSDQVDLHREFLDCFGSCSRGKRHDSGMSFKNIGGLFLSTAARIFFQ